MEFGLNHLSTGDMLRDAVTKNTELGLLAKEAMHAGKLVSDELVAKIVGHAIKTDAASSAGFILDGFPRTVEQAVILDEILAGDGVAIDCVVNLDVTDELLVKRVTGRLIHPASGRSYNVYFNPPREEGKDDVTGEPLIKRGDDTEEKLRTRLNEFHEKTQPVLAHYADKTVTVQADDHFDRITDSIREALLSVKLEKQNKSTA